MSQCIADANLEAERNASMNPAKSASGSADAKNSKVVEELEARLVLPLILLVTWITSKTQFTGLTSKNGFY